MSETEPLPDFVSHLEGGIEELKTTSSGTSNLLTFINEITQLSETSPDNIKSDGNDMIPSPDRDPENIILTNIHGESDFMSQIIEVRKKLKKKEDIHWEEMVFIIFLDLLNLLLISG